MSAPEASILKVRRSIWIDASPARAWNAFTSIEAMTQWWGAAKGEPLAGTNHGQWLDVYEPRLGGRIEMSVQMDGARVSFGGEIVTFTPERELTFANDWIPNRGWAAPTFITLRLSPALNGALLELFHHGFERTGPDGGAELEGYEQGWGMTQLSALKALAESKG